MSMNSTVARQLSHQSFLQQNRTLTRIIAMLTVFGISALLCLPAYATQDLMLIIGAKITVYFEKDEEPHDKHVDFTINCYRYYDVDLEKLFSLSATCPHYGCEIDGPDLIPRFDEITYCDCEGETEGEEFVSVYYPTPLDISVYSLPQPNRDPEYFPDGYRVNQARRGFLVFELRFDIPTSGSDGNEEATDSDTDDDNDGGCFITSLLQP